MLIRKHTQEDIKDDLFALLYWQKIFNDTLIYSYSNQWPKLPAKESNSKISFYNQIKFGEAIDICQSSDGKNIEGSSYSEKEKSRINGLSK